MNPAPSTIHPRPAVRGLGETILLIEGDLCVREPLTEILTRVGYHVLAAGSIEEALSAWQRHRDVIRAVVSDSKVGHAKADLALLHEFSHAKPSLIMVLAAGSMSQEVVQELERTKTLRHLPKPFSYLELLEMLREGLDAQPA